MTKYSFVIPVYNRPDELKALLESINTLNHNNFEVIVVEDGSTTSSEPVVNALSPRYPLSYYRHENMGPGLSRNAGVAKASGDYLIFFDSDCLVPSEYLAFVEARLQENRVAAFGGPDRAHDSFSTTQKAINYAMTSPLTTGGIRGGNKQLEKYKPRSFNMGIRKDVYEKTGGFRDLRYGEDIDLMLRLEQAGYDAVLIPQAFVYHIPFHSIPFHYITFHSTPFHSIPFRSC